MRNFKDSWFTVCQAVCNGFKDLQNVDNDDLRAVLRDRFTTYTVEELICFQGLCEDLTGYTTTDFLKLKRENYMSPKNLFAEIFYQYKPEMAKDYLWGHLPDSEEITKDVRDLFIAVAYDNFFDRIYTMYDKDSTVLQRNLKDVIREIMAPQIN